MGKLVKGDFSQRAKDLRRLKMERKEETREALEIERIFRAIKKTSDK